ncbi:MAG: secreted trypsin-like serine protease [Crocinitomix sp.]|jgi:secreted trypsin-like serine protease
MKNKRVRIATFLFAIFGFIQAQAQEVVTETGDSVEGVVGGDIVEPGDFPWVVSLAMSNGDPGCGASLIAPRWVLTAGHCHFDIDAPGIPVIDKVIINSVIIDVDALEPFSELIDVEMIIVHEDYGGIFLGTGPDIALIRLSADAITSPIELATFDDISYFEGNQPAQVLGWGKTEAGGGSVDSLLHADCIFVDHDTCATLYEPAGAESMFNANPDGNICAGFFSGDVPAGAAQGDSGGPLFFTDIDGVHKQVGVVSGGNSDVTTEDFPGIFTLIPKYKEWIDSIMNVYDVAASVTTDNRENLSINYFANDRIEINGLVEENVYLINVFDMTGRLVTQIDAFQGNTSYEIGMTNGKAGLHVLQVVNRSKGIITIEKFVVN